MFDSREVEAMGEDELVDALRRAHGAAAFAQAAEVTAVREMYRRHRAVNAEPGAGGVRAGEFAAAEIAVAVQVSEGVAAALIDIGLALDSLPQTKLAFAAGRIDLSRVQVITDCLRGLSREVREVLEPKLIDAALRSDPARLRQTAQRWVIRLDPKGETRRRETREQDRDVRIRAVQDGMAVFEGLLPAAGAQALAMRLREMSLQVCDQDPRTMAQRRADALIALADGSGRLHCDCGKNLDCPKADAPTTTRRPLIQVGVAAETLLGLRDDPAFLAGYGPIDANLARSLAEHARFQVIPEYFPDDTEHSRDGSGPGPAITGTADLPTPSAKTRTANAGRERSGTDESATGGAGDGPRPRRTRRTRRTRIAAEAPWERAAAHHRQALDDSSTTPRVDRGRLTTDGAAAPEQLAEPAVMPNQPVAPVTAPNRFTAAAESTPDQLTSPAALPNQPTAPAPTPDRSAATADSDPVAKPHRKRAKVAGVRPFSNAPAREVRAVDGFCRFPGCTMPAAETSLIQFGPLPNLPAPQPNSAYRAVLCTHHNRLKSLADKGKHPWRVYLADTDRMRWIDPSGETHETVREGARYLFPHTDIDAPARPPRLRAIPTESSPPGSHFTADLAYPLETHVLIHPQLSRATADNDIPETPTPAVPH
ncbi:DUF222 domain-containing protein [Nocardia tengchongensis]|uniref:DUF222 domain-containing protein n=1 Tax=Nocardia tengchongensis TaxID=2055889 RepID=UPI003681570C